MNHSDMKRLEELAGKAKDRWNARMFEDGGPLCEFIGACTPEVVSSLLKRMERLEALVSETSRQHLPDEMEAPEHADFEGAYIIMVNKARSLLTEDQSS